MAVTCGVSTGAEIVTQINQNEAGLSENFKDAYIDTISDLGLIDLAIFDVVNIKGYNSINDGGGGVFNYDATIDRTTANGGTIIDATGTGTGNGCWVRQYEGSVNVKWFGAVGDGVTDDSPAFNSAIQASSVVEVDDTASGYLLGATLAINKPVTLRGISEHTKLKVNTAMQIFTITSSEVRIESFRIDGNPATPASVFLLGTSVTSMDFIYLEGIYSLNCADFVKDEANGINTIVNLHIKDCTHRLSLGRGVLLADAFAFIFFTNFTIDYVGVTAPSSNVPAFSVSNNQGLICTDCDILGGEITGFATRWGFNVEDSAATHFIRCNADTMGGYGFRFVNVESVRLVDTTASLCDNIGYLIAGTTFDLQGSNVYARGRDGLTPATASVNGIDIQGTTANTNLSNVTTKNNTGHGIQTSGTSTEMINGIYSHSNVGYGVNMGGTSSLVNGAKTVANGTGNYFLVGAV